MLRAQDTHTVEASVQREEPARLGRSHLARCERSCCSLLLTVGFAVSSTRFAFNDLRNRLVVTRIGSHASAGTTEDKPRQMTGLAKRDWRYIPQPDLVWPEGKMPHLQKPEVQEAVRALLGPSQAAAEAKAREDRKAREQMLAAAPEPAKRPHSLHPKHFEPEDPAAWRPKNVGPFTPGLAEKDIVLYNWKPFAYEEPQKQNFKPPLESP